MTQPLALPNYTSFGSVITPDLKRGAAFEALDDAGWRWLGSGATAQVYRSPHGDRVIKVVAGDDGNRATIEAAMAHPDNPHLPKVYGLMDLSGGAFAVEMEPLESGHGAHSDWSSRWSPTYYSHWDAGDGLPEELAEEPDCAMKAALQALENAAAEYGGMRWDCHGGNIMVRPSTGEIVLNDLLYSGTRHECERCQAGFDPDDEGIHINGEVWCGACQDAHTVFCAHDEEWVEADPDEAIPAIAARTWWGDWSIDEQRIAAENREAAIEAGNYVFDEANNRFIEANLYAAITAIEGIAQEALALTIEPRLPLAIAA